MRCPRCVHGLPADASRCPHCGFALFALNEAFGSDSVFLDRLTDAARVLGHRERRLIEKSLDRFEARFPQVFAAAYLGFLPPQTNVREFGFWLLNRAAVTSVDFHKPNSHGVLFVVDMNSRTVGITLGYFLEPYFIEGELIKVLRSATPMFVAEDYGRALLRCLQSFSGLLKRRCGEVRSDPGRFHDLYRMPDDGLGLRSIREGHRMRESSGRES